MNIFENMCWEFSCFFLYLRFGPEKHQTIDFNDGEQTVVYYSGIDVPEDEQEHLYYGTVDKISGAGKGGGTHTEYFLILDHVD